MAEENTNRIDMLMERFKQRVNQPNRIVMFGQFVTIRLKKLGITHDQAAQVLDLPVELVEAILQGQMPDWEIDDTLLNSIASLVKRHPAVLKVMLGRPVSMAEVNDSDDADAPLARRKQK